MLERDLFIPICILLIDRFFQLFEKYNGPKQGHLKLKHPGQLQVCSIGIVFLFEIDAIGL